MSYFRRPLGATDAGFSTGTTASPSGRAGAPTISKSPPLALPLPPVKSPPVIVDCARGFYPDTISGQCVAFSTEGALPPSATAPPNAATPMGSASPWLLYGGIAVAAFIAYKYFGKESV